MELINRDECCGCGACVDSCPKSAIELVANKKGFLYPQIDLQKCVQCGKCNKICAINNHIQLDNKPNYYAAFKTKNKDILYKSSSGGVFFTVASEIIKKNGYVYGAVFCSKEQKVKHVEAHTIDELNPMMGSKYVQSETVGVFNKIRDRLSKGNIVLFTGTPCQCAQVREIAKGMDSNLYLLDLMCHGVPSPRIFLDHIHHWEKKKKSKIVKYEFRNKKYGYDYNHKAEFANGRYDCSIELKRILKLYEYSMRTCCYSCPYTSRNRVGDITIGDLWEAGLIINDFEHSGTSTIIVNTEKGQNLIQAVQDQCVITKIDANSINPDCLNKPVLWKNKYQLFWDDYFKFGYQYVLDKYGRSTLKSKVYQSMLRILFFFKLDRLFVKIKARYILR